jgi:hypothetical protein
MKQEGDILNENDAKNSGVLDGGILCCRNRSGNGHNATSDAK